MPHSPMQGEPITLPRSRSRIGECRTRNSAPHVLSVLLLRCRHGVLLTLVLLLGCCTTLLMFTELAGPSKISRQVASPSPQSSSQSPQQPSALPRHVTVDSVGVGARGAAAGDTQSGGAGAGGARAGSASSGGAGAGGSGTGGASSRGAGAGGAGTSGASSGGAGARGAGAVELECEEQEQLEQKSQELQNLDHRQQPQQQQQPPQSSLLQQLFPRVSGLRALGLPSSPPVHSQSPIAYGPTFPPPDSTPSVFSPPQSPSPPPVVRHDWTTRCPPRARPSSPLADLRTILFRSPPHRSRPVSVLPSPPKSSLTVSSHPITDYYCTARPVVSRVLASLVTDPRASPSSVSALTAAVTDFASIRRLDYATRVVGAPPHRPLSVEGESALGYDIPENRQFELEILAAASPSLCAMLLSLEKNPDALDIPTPRTYREAVSGKWACQLKAAMYAELASWRSTGTYVDVVPPPRANVVDGMWLFKVKRPLGSPPVFKARYVARGFSQREGVDFFQTFVPTPKITTLRVLLHIAAQQDYELHSLDFSIAFHQGRLHEEIWLRRPPGFTDTFPPGTQWSLRRPVYSLRQSSREWHDTLRSTLRDLGFHPSSANPSLFDRTGSTHFFILVYVNDLVFATADRAALNEVKSELEKRHKCTDLGELQRFLGLQITRDRATRTITLTQSHMVQHVLRRFEFQFSTTQPTPLAVDHRLTGPFPDEHFESRGPYAELVGYLMYLMTCTRPDLAFPLSALSRFVATRRHHPVHWTAAVRVARYLATTSGMGLVLGGTQPVVLTGHCDSSYADDVETRRSTQGYCFSLSAGAVSWRSTRSSSVASSSVEAEIYVGAMAAQELCWLNFLLTNLGERPRSAPILYADNKAMILLCQEPRLESRLKHIDVRYFLLRELQRLGQARLDFVASEANTADVFTKALAPGDHHRFCVELGLVEVGPRLL
ncbi:unnamed protein product [Closterium sp. NIES-53]